MDTSSFTAEALKSAFRMMVKTWRVPQGTLGPSQEFLTRILKILERRLKKEKSSFAFPLGKFPSETLYFQSLANAKRLQSEVIAELEAGRGKLTAEESGIVERVFDQALSQVKIKRGVRVTH